MIPGTFQKKNPSVCVCVCSTNLDFSVEKYCLGFSVGYQRAPGSSEKKQNAWYQRALRCQLRGRPFHPWAGPLRFSGAATLTQSSSSSCGAGLQSESRLLRCCAPAVYMLAVDAAVAAAVFSLEHLISYCNHTKTVLRPHLPRARLSLVPRDAQPQAWGGKPEACLLYTSPSPRD